MLDLLAVQSSTTNATIITLAYYALPCLYLIFGNRLDLRKDLPRAFLF
jgi:hypothetical protein